MQRGKWGSAFQSCCEDERDGREDLKKVVKEMEMEMEMEIQSKVRKLT